MGFKDWREQKGFSLVIPAYNEEKRVKKIVEAYYAYLKQGFKNFELIIACNNCSDTTPKIARELAKGRKEIKVLNFPGYTGKGGAVLQAFKVTSKGILGFTDCDQSTQPKQFDKLFAQLPEFDAVIGSRAMPDSRVINSSPVRTVLGRIFSLITKILFSFNFNDTQCGAKIFKREAVLAVLPSIKTTGWAFDVELLWKMRQNGSRIKEVGITWQNSPESKVGFSSPFSMLLELLKMRFS